MLKLEALETLTYTPLHPTKESELPQCNNLQADAANKGYSCLLCLPLLLKTPGKSLLELLPPHL